MTKGSDGRMDISELYLKLSKIECKNTPENKYSWKIKKVCDSYSTQDVRYFRESEEIDPFIALLRPEGLKLPIISINNNMEGPALWILAGMHGDEPSGPNMIAQNIEYIVENLSDIPTLILPLCNPHGYRLRQRYLNDTVEDVEGLSVDDASQALLNNITGNIVDTDYMEGYIPRSETGSYESEQIVRHLLKENAIRPPIITIDLQEDSRSNEGHIDSYGIKRYEDKHAYRIVEEMAKIVEMKNYKNMGNDRFIIKSVGYPSYDNSIAEFIAAKKIISNDIIKGIGARIVLKTKVPARFTPLDRRIEAQKNALYAAIDMAKSEIKYREELGL